MLKELVSTPVRVATGLRLARASEWWAYKFAPLLGTAYATVVLARVPLAPLLPQVLLLLLASTVGATFVSLLNDWTDRADDAAAGKTNRLAHKSAGFVTGALGLCVVAGLGFGGYFWRASPLGSLLYGGAWLAYALYSLPPFRLKVRGLAGVLADAAGAHLLPHLFTAVLLSAWAGWPAAGAWLLAVGGWALGAGIRNILWHQLGDEAADRRAGVRTFVVKQGAARAKMVAASVALPLELLGLVSLLWQLAAALPLLALGGYAALA
ncbi:MAG: UbiA family prenyltransferase, partial [Bacteroidota bacterium]|nr:UbiA family prenyltransferase [Bacteroidota bacterium]